MLIADVYRGFPVVYVSLVSYDEVAHHSGTDRTDALKVLTTIDQMVAILERAVASAPRPYHVVVLSDHGQSMGPTFRQQYGQTLGHLVTGLVEPGSRYCRPGSADWGCLMWRSVRQSGGNQPSLGTMLAGSGKEKGGGETPLARLTGESGGRSFCGGGSDDVSVVPRATGLVHSQSSERMTYEQIVDRFPIDLRADPAYCIGLVLVHSERKGADHGARGNFYS